MYHSSYDAKLKIIAGEILMIEKPFKINSSSMEKAFDCLNKLPLRKFF